MRPAALRMVMMAAMMSGKGKVRGQLKPGARMSAKKARRLKKKGAR